MLFKDRTEAAILLAEKLKWLKEEGPRGSLLVLAVPRGGVVTGDIVATSLGVNLDIIVAKKIGHPSNPEVAIGAVMHDGTFIPNEAILNSLDIPYEYITDSISILMKEIERRIMIFRGSKEYDLVGKVVILIDDGVATGTTLFAAIMWLKRQKLRRLIVAIPVGPKETIKKLRETVDQVIVLHSPTMFEAVGAFYEDFSQVTDDEVIEIMQKYRTTN
jgi:putative phosphoribosyl transferase